MKNNHQSGELDKAATCKGILQVLNEGAGRFWEGCASVRPLYMGNHDWLLMGKMVLVTADTKIDKGKNKRIGSRLRRSRGGGTMKSMNKGERTVGRMREEGPTG